MAGLELLYGSVQGQITGPQDAVVCCVHWAIVRSGLKCIGIGEQPPDDLSSVRRSETLPGGWSASQDLYTLLYVDTNDRVYLLKAIRMENVLLTHFMRLSDETMADLMIDVSRYTSQDLGSYHTAFTNLEELEAKIKKEVLEKVLSTWSGTQTGTSSQQPRSTEQSRSSEQKRDPLIDDDPLRVGPRRPVTRHPPEWGDPGDPFSIGRGDLDPIAGGVGGGMVFDPMRSGFSGRGIDPSAGLPGRLPPGAVPPGARFDPFGPPNPNRGDHRGGRYAGPDPDHLPPPGYDDMFM